MTWMLSNRFDREALPLADRHYNRRKIGSPQFVPPGRCVVLRQAKALWVTSWPFAEYVRHAWPGAWVNSLFRSEGAGKASDLILEAIAVTRSIWQPPELGLDYFRQPEARPAEDAPRATDLRLLIPEGRVQARRIHQGRAVGVANAAGRHAPRAAATGARSMTRHQYVHGE